QLLYIVHHCGFDCQIGSTRTFSDYIFSAPVLAFYNFVFCLLINFKANRKKTKQNKRPVYLLRAPSKTQ
ncbi:hypothetical protein BgiBS90_011964, partial [Biomphalaria glabrata]